MKRERTPPMRIALRGPAYAGKSTLAAYLRDHYGFAYVNYTDHLKHLACRALGSVGYLVDIQEMRAKKGQYRAFLQDLGELLDFDHGYGIDEVLADLHEGEDAVFDNVRFLSQWERLKPHGFQLVSLAIDPLAQEARAATHGVSRAALGRVLAHPAELGFPIQDHETIVDAELPTADIAARLVENLGKGDFLPRFARDGVGK